MSTTKFGKYFTTDVLKESPKFPGLWDVSSTRHLTGFGGGHLSVDCIFITHAFVMVGQPHKHEFAQYLHFFAANPGDQRQFDAEIEMTLGPEGEKHIVNTPTVLHIPKGLVHGPLDHKKIDKPIRMVDIYLGPVYVRKAPNE